MEWIWIGIIVALFLSELVSLKFTSIWFILGAIINIILVKFELSYSYQVACFIIVGLIQIVFIRPKIIDKLVTKRDNIIKKIIDKAPFCRHFISKDLLPVEPTKNNNNKMKKKSKKK